MSLSASEYFEAGLALPASVRKDVALRLLESLEVVDDARRLPEAGRHATTLDKIARGLMQDLGIDVLNAADLGPPG